MHWWKKVIYIIVVANLTWSCSDKKEVDKAPESKSTFLDDLAKADYLSLETSYQQLTLDSNFIQLYPLKISSEEKQFFFPTEQWKDEIYHSIQQAHKVKDSSARYYTGYSTQKKATVHFYLYPPDTTVCVLEIHG